MAKSTMEEHSIVPDVIDTVPPNLIKISYANDLTVNLGNEITPPLTKDPPIKVEWPVEDGALYTLIMSDPDAPFRRFSFPGEIKHWQVVNIPGCNINAGNCLADYRGSGPPKFGGLHRYVFLVYKQPGQIDLPADKPIDSTSRKGRLFFRVREFAKQYNLGEPIAANFYLSQHGSV